MARRSRGRGDVMRCRRSEMPACPGVSAGSPRILTSDRRRRRDAGHITSSRSRLKAGGDEADVHGMDALAAALTRSSLLVLAGAGLAAATWLAFSASRRNRHTDPAPDRDLALSEAEHERDVSIARAAEATERERLARERLATLAPLEARLEIAERRALDAERRLDALTERVAGEPTGSDDVGSSEDGSNRQTETDRPEPAPGRSAQLRSRLARSAARKRPPRDR